MKGSQRTVWNAVLLLAITLIAYLPAMHGDFSLDDDVLITDNHVINADDGLKYIWRGVGVPDYYPLTYSLFWVEWRLWGLHPGGYHLINVLLHCVGVFLLWRVLLRLRVPGAWFAALLFAIHPVCAGTVAWISEGKNTLSFVFYALSAWLFLKAQPQRTESEPTSAPPFNRRLYWFAFAAFVLALFSKSSVIVLPVLLLGCLWWLNGKVSPLDVRRLIPFFLATIVFAAITVWFQNNRAGAANIAYDLSFESRLALAGKNAWFYFWKDLFPVNLCFVYPQSTVGDLNFASFIPDLCWLGIIAICLTFRRTFGTAALLAIGYFLIVLSPILGFFKMYYFIFSNVADHLQYLAVIGVVVLLVSAIWKYSGNLQANNYQMANGICGCIAAIFLIGTWHQATIHSDVEALWRDTLEKNPNSWAAHANLAGILRDKGKPDEAVPHYLKSIELNTNFANAHLELAGILVSQGNLPEATYHFGEAARIKPTLPDAHFNYGMGLSRLGKTSEAIAQFTEALRLNPGHLLARNELAHAYAQMHDLDKAEAELNIALQMKPDFAFTHNNLGHVLKEKGKLDEAAQHFRAAVQLDPQLQDAQQQLAELASKR